MIKKLKFHFKAFISSNFYDSDGLYTIHNQGFRNDPEFVSAYNEGAKTGSWGESPEIQWRVHVFLWAAKNCLRLEGDFVECGVNKGGFCKSFLSFIDFNLSKKTFWLFDTFEGKFNYSLLTDKEIEKIKSKGYQYNQGIDYSEWVKKQFKNDNVKIIKGLVPDSLGEFKGQKVAFLSIDMNSSFPEISALDFFWEKLSIGAFVVLDDYAYYSHEDQYKAINKFCKSKGISILSLPTGQGLIIR